jgi:ribosome-binding protein aMBF1 (putative translation factor)
MATTLEATQTPRHLTRLESVRPVQAKADLKKVDPEWIALVGAAVSRAFQLAGLTQKEAAAALDRNPAQVSRWCSGQERPQFDVLFAVEALRVPMVIALAGLIDGVAVETTIHVRRMA